MGTINDFKYFHAKFSGYQVSDEKVDSGDADITYLGYVNNRGEWYIMKEDITVSGTSAKAWRFIKGSSDYATSWTAREALSYDTFQATFA